MKTVLVLLSFLIFVFPSFGQSSERPQAIVIPISSLGAVTKIQKQILQNTFEDNLKSHFTLISQELYEQAQEKAFQELDYEECTDDQCIILIQEMLQVENAFHLQVIREGKNTQLALSWRTLDEKKKETDICRNCDTFEINDRVEKLFLTILGKRYEQNLTVFKKNKEWLRFYGSRNIGSIYYKFLENIGLGISNIKSEPIQNVCMIYYTDGSCRRNSDLQATLNGIFIQIGYDLSLGNVVFNTNLGLLLDGKVTSSWFSDYERKLDQTSSYNIFLSLGYRGKKEYGIGITYSKLKQKGENKTSVGQYIVNTETNFTTQTISSYQITEIRPVLWMGLNW